MVCMRCGWAWMVAVELRCNAHREDQPASCAYLCLDCVREAALEVDEFDGDPESNGSC